jgi:hypothetical protein
MDKAKSAFVGESGIGLRREYAEVDDELFTLAGFKAYADDALLRMVPA